MRPLLPLLGAVAATPVAAAALISVNGGAVATGAAAIAACDADGFAVAYTTTGGNVSDVEVSGIAPGCTNGRLRVALVDGTGAAVGAGGPQTITASSATVSVSPQPAAISVRRAELVVEGP